VRGGDKFVARARDIKGLGAILRAVGGVAAGTRATAADESL